MSKRIPYDNKSHKRVIRDAIRAKEAHRMSFLRADVDDSAKSTKKSRKRGLWCAVAALLAIGGTMDHAMARGSSTHRTGNHGHHSAASGDAVSSFRSIYR